MSKNNGGPAFPVPVAATPDGNVYHSMEIGGRTLGGMTLRDYFAANALQGLMANKSNPLHFNPEDDSAYVYRIADAMLAERDKENNDADR